MAIYGSVENADTYFLDRGNSTWADLTAGQKAIALLRGSEFIDGFYSSNFPGKKTGARSQVRQWPRIDAFDIDGESIASDVIPTEIEHATYEAALQESITPGSLTPVIDLTERYKSVSVEGAVSITYADLPLSTRYYRPIVTRLNAIIEPVLTRSGNSSLSGVGYRV